MRYSTAEIYADLEPISPLSRWLFEKLTDLPPFVAQRGSKTFGDSPLALLTAIGPEAGTYHERFARKMTDEGAYGSELEDV